MYAKTGFLGTSLKLLVLMAAAMLLVQVAPLAAQTLISGDVTGTVTDPSGAVLPNVNVTLKSNEIGQSQTTATNAQGFFRFPLVRPGSYTLSYSAANFQSATRQITVAVGQATNASVQMGLSASSQTVNVTAEAPIIETENGNISTTFTSNQIALIPNPGNDISYVAQSAPGATMNTQAGYGNFSTFGLPATSNLFTYNGQNENDPFFNVNNTGASNLQLGANDVREVTVVNNGYTGQYGGLAGANVNYVSKSGSNTWHGNAVYWWNGSALNANEWFAKQAGNPRLRVNDNQWAASIGGPIIHDKTFFFVDTEGLRVLLPTSATVLVPSPQFQAATLANVGPGSAVGQFYTQLFKVFNGAPGVGSAAPVPGGGCGTFTGLPAGTPCALRFVSNVSNFNPEWMLTGRIDQNIGQNDRAFIHFRTDHGTQATFTSPFTPALNAISNQPQYEGQFNETHTFGPNTVNQFIAAASWYSAAFNLSNPTAALQTVPFEIGFSGAFTRPGRDMSVFPQGRRSTQYQFIDDLSHTVGKHNLKVGLNFTRNDISDLDPGIGTIGFATTTLSSFFNGVVTNYAQSFVPRLAQPIARYGLGFYGQDEWAVTQRLKLTLAMRFDHNSNPICNTNCFGNLVSPFENITHDVNTPYNQVINTGLAQMITGTRWPKFDYEPRIGFAFSPFGPSRSTVIRGGIGLFADFLPATIADNLMNNSPLNNRFTLTGLPLTPALATTAAAANAAFLNGFNSGGTFSSLSTSPDFVVPNFFTLGPIVRDPNYAEWNLELQQGFGNRTALSINYVGNHGYHELIQNLGLNSFCDVTPVLPGETAGGTCAATLGAGAGFNGLPLAPADPRFGTVGEAQSVGVSNYNGVTLSLKERLSSLQIQANYTWSHALDEISNNGLLAFNFNTNSSILNQINPFCLRCNNYGNADYDVRHYFSLNYVFNSPDRKGPHGVLGGWVLAGTLFVRSGLPYSVTDNAATSVLNAFNYGTSADGGASPQVLAGILGTPPLSCPGGITGYNPNGAPCEVASDFTGVSVPTLGFLNQRRNQFRGPGFLDTDFSVTKNFHIPKWEGGTLGVGANFFNILNHPNFDQPVGDISNPLFGTVQSTVAPPTTPFGAFIGSSASFRIIQLNARITF